MKRASYGLKEGKLVGLRGKPVQKAREKRSELGILRGESSKGPFF